MASAVGIVLVKQFAYRDEPNEEWSSKYWLTGNIPSGDASWKTLADLLIAQEATCYHAGVSVTFAYSYDDNTEGAHSVWSYDYLAAGEAVPGTLASAGGTKMAGDQAGVLEWKTDRKNTRGKWIYLRKYFHGGHTDAVQPDRLEPATLTAYEAFGQKLRFATPELENRNIRSQKQEEGITDHYGIPWVTTRTLKRRGKRP